MRYVARLRSLVLPHAGDWLCVTPSPALGLHLRTVEFIVSIKYTVQARHPACRDESDEYGDQAISCGSEGERIARHNHLRDALFQTTARAAPSPSMEERALIPGSNSKPADVLIPNWTQHWM